MLRTYKVEEKGKKGIEAAGEDAVTHKMSSEEVRRTGAEGFKRPPGNNPGEVLHQRRKLPFSTATMAVTGFGITAAIGYMVLYAKKKPEASAGDVTKVATGAADPKDTHPRE
ncbi:hypothetical protein POTOM_056794 [Populus tomentosa]|uniref:Transmembrane protein n=1 Tax=Populus tomentosa TaxID=118781 RepID=A0A8X8C3A9_POPTO|nr:hypothetical protein POTOM_056794 [Populus tomentosa]